MKEFENFKKANYKQNVCVSMEEGGVVFFDPDSKNDVVGAEKMTYDEYLDIQIKSNNQRSYFRCCYFNIPLEFKGQVEKIKKNTICFERIFVSGMYHDGECFDGKEDHVWIDKKGFEDLQVGDCVSFGAEVYRYVKTGNGKRIDYSLRNPSGIKRIEKYELPTDDELLLQEIHQIICETCFLSEQCNRVVCMRNKQEKRALKKQLFDMAKGSKQTHREE